MQSYSKDTVYIVGDAKTATHNPITIQYSAFYIALVIDINHHIIKDVGASATLPVTNEFIKSLFIGYSMEKGIEPMIQEISKRYYGSSQKALVVAWKDAYKKYLQVKKDEAPCHTEI